MIRGGHIDLTVLGAMEVAENGDIANWMIPGKMIKGMGGAMDLVAGVKKIIVVMEHVSKNGDPKFIPECTLPLTGKNVVDMIVTDLCVFHRPDHQSPFRLIELAPDVTAEEVAAKTTARYEVAQGLNRSKTLTLAADGRICAAMFAWFRRRYLDLLGSIYIYNEHRGYTSIDRILEAVRGRTPEDTAFIAAIEKHRADERKHYVMFKRWFELQGKMPLDGRPHLRPYRPLRRDHVPPPDRRSRHRRR